MGDKIPLSVLVVLHDEAGRVLLLERADHPGFWQSVTGSLDRFDEQPIDAARREVHEETGLLLDFEQIEQTNISQRYSIFPHWRFRYPEGVTHNTEYLFFARVSGASPVRLSPREHLRYQWMTAEEAEERCFSWTNVLAIRELRRRCSKAIRPGSHCAPAELTLVSYNIHKGRTRSGLSLRSRLVVHDLSEAIEGLSADIVCLQEVQGRNDRLAARHRDWPAQGQTELLAPPGFNVAYGEAARYLHGHHGNAVLTRLPILHQEAQDFSDHALEKRSTLHVLLDLGADVLHLYVVHFGLFAAGRARQLNRLMDWIEAATPSHAPLLVAGDFNDWQLRLAPDLWARLRLREAVPHGRGRPLRTFPSIMPLASMDRIFYRGFELASLRRAPAGHRWARLSDHLPLIAGLRFAGSQPST